MKLDPRTKMLLCITVSSVMLASNSKGIFAYVEPVLILVPFAFLIGMRKSVVALYYGLLYLFCLFVPDFVMPYLPMSLNYLVTGIVAMMTEIIPGMSMFCFLVLSTTVSEFVAAMDRMHVPKSFSVPVSVMFRFFPTIWEEYGHIKNAMRLRGVGSLRNPIQMLEYRMVPLLVEIVSIGNDLSASALTRGLDAPYARTNICPIGFHTRDMVAFLFCFVIIVLFVLSRVLGI